MRRFILYLLVLLVAIWLGLKIAADPGYVLFAWHHWTLEMPLWLAGVLLLLMLTLLSMVGKIWRMTRRFFAAIMHYFQNRKAEKAQKMTSQGLLDLAEGKWAKAEKALIKATNRVTSPLINYLAAARAAQEQGAYERRDDYLRAAHACAPFAEVAIGLTQAQLQLGSKQLEYGLATLKHLQSLEPHHVYVLKLLKRLYIELGDWGSLLASLDELKKRKVIDHEEYDNLQKQCYLHQFKNISGHTPEDLTKIWNKMPKDLRYNKQLVITYMEQLLKEGKNTQAESVLKEAIRHQWDADLVKLYGNIPSENPAKQLETAESWLKQEGQSANLLLTLGRLCLRNELWGKARQYLEASLAMDPQPDAWAQLGQLFEKQGDNYKAMDAYKLGLENILQSR